MADLLPCPFCGSHDVASSSDELGGYFVMCNDCNAQGPWLFLEKEATDGWNRRTFKSPYSHEASSATFASKDDGPTGEIG